MEGGSTDSTNRGAAGAPDVHGHPVLDASPMAVVGVDGDGRIVYANRQVASTFGWTPADLVGRPLEVLVPDESRREHGAQRRRWNSNPTARAMGIAMEIAGRRQDGSTFPAEVSLAPVSTALGTVTYATIVDTSVRRSLEEQLLQAQKMESVGRLAGGIAHDFNNMLFAIRGHASLVMDDLETLAADPVALAGLARSVAAIDGAAERAGALVKQLLTFSRRSVVRAADLPLAEAVRDLEPMLRRLIDARVKLDVQLDDATGLVRADRSQIDQVIVNLVVNARDAMPLGGTITIETANVEFDEPYAVEHFEVTPGPYVMLAVADTGVGMDRATRLRLFEPFFTTKAPGRGTGLGLSTIYGIVRQAGGHIWVYSEPGRGTRFKVYLPRMQGEDTQAPVPVMAPTLQRVAQGRILLVEDEAAVRDLTREVLTRAGYDVTAPDDASAALALLGSAGSEFDIVVTDLIMPDVSGREIAQRALDAPSPTAVVLLSGYSAESAAIEDLVARGAVFASKPVSTADLLENVRAARAARAASAT